VLLSSLKLNGFFPAFGEAERQDSCCIFIQAIARTADVSFYRF